MSVSCFYVALCGCVWDRRCGTFYALHSLYFAQYL